MNKNIDNIAIKPPTIFIRIYSVWYRHFRVYTKNLFSNGIPVFLEPLFFLAAIGLGLGQYITTDINGISFIKFLASGILVPPAMFTAAYECTFGTFIRLEFDKVYDGMLSASISVEDLLIGEIIFAGMKGLFFSACVLLIISIFGLVTYPMAILAPIGGFLTGLMFATLSLLVTSFVININHFNFYFTGLLTPMFFFSGIVFPLDTLPMYIRCIAEFSPLIHSARIVRAFCINSFNLYLLLDLLYIIIFTAVIGFFAIKRLKKRLIN